KLLLWEEFDEVRDLRRSITLDFLYNSLIFAAEKGLPWPAVAGVGTLAGELLNETKGTSAIQILKEKLASCRLGLAPCNLGVLCDYFQNTFLKHYLLYQFVLCRERDHRQTFTSLAVQVPPLPLPLMEGINAEVWKYQQQLADLTAAENQKRTRMLLLRETLHLEREHLLQKVYDDLKTGQRQSTLERLWALETLVTGAIRTQMQALREILQMDIKTTFEILELRLQKKTLMLSPPIPYPPPPSTEDRAKKSTKAQEQQKKKKKK
uniref:Chromosome 8 open reading frame 74 n=1 Tax=Sphenodon punctatus TaxID=8508 RepID=A0A8D0G5W5_SPHPU